VVVTPRPVVVYRSYGYADHDRHGPHWKRQHHGRDWKRRGN
jgi:hypothetical protein